VRGGAAATYARFVQNRERGSFPCLALDEAVSFGEVAEESVKDRQARALVRRCL
jgi:hypothetical protein